MQSEPDAKCASFALEPWALCLWFVPVRSSSQRIIPQHLVGSPGFRFNSKVPWATHVRICLSSIKEQDSPFVPILSIKSTRASFLECWLFVAAQTGKRDLVLQNNSECWGPPKTRVRPSHEWIQSKERLCVLYALNVS